MIVQYHGILGMKKPGEGFFIIGTQMDHRRIENDHQS